MKLTRYSLIVLLSGCFVIACSKKEKEPELTDQEPAVETPKIPNTERPENPEIGVSDDMESSGEAAEVPAAAPAQPSSEQAKPNVVKPQVDPQLIEQRQKTYRDDIAAYQVKLDRFEGVQERLKGDDPEFDTKFSELAGAYRQEKQNFEKKLKSIKKNPSLVQWENKEREWADEWRHVVRAFNDLEALYEKQYEGLK